MLYISLTDCDQSC